MTKIVNTIQEIENLLNIIEGEHLFLVGAGELGRIIGECLEAEGKNYDGYIDGVKSGELNGKKIVTYEECTNVSNTFFIITSPQNTPSIEKCLEDINAKKVYSFDSTRLIYEYYAMHNKLMAQWIEGSCRYSSFGEKDPEKVYMVLERSMIFEGIFSNVRRFLMGIDYADRKGYIPVIDQLYYPAFEYQTYESIGYDNPWEYFYEQPGGRSVEYVTTGCKNVRYYNMDDTINVKYLSAPASMSANGIVGISRWNYLARKYLRLNENIKKEISEEKQRLFPSGAKVLGTKFRELMIVNMQHKCNRGPMPIQPEIETQISDIKRCMKEWNCDYVYLMCETSDVFQKMKEEFGERLICCERERTNMENAMTATQIRFDVLHNKTTDKVKKTKDYLIEAYLLAECDALISGSNGAAEMACVIKGEFENIKLYDYGYSENFTS